MYLYMIYNCVISSEIKLFNIPACEGTPVAAIKFVKKASEHIPNKICGTYYSPAKHCLGTSYGTIEVSNGNLMEIFLYENCTEEDIVPFIIGWGFAFLFAQREYTIFHCSALNINGRGVLVSGVSGAGKSTIALSLIKQGATYLADDMAILKPAESFDIIPAYPLQKVCQDVSIDLALDKEKLIHINEGRNKYAYYNQDEYCDKPVEITTIVLLNKSDTDHVIAKEITGLDKYLKVLSCMYLVELFVTFGTPEKDKYNCLQIAGKIRLLEITRPQNGDTVDEITKIIKEFV